MACEPKRGCGYRKVGGTYLVSSGAGLPCDRLPFPLTVCPTCSCGIKFSRGWTWVEPGALFEGEHNTHVYEDGFGYDKPCDDRIKYAYTCPVCYPQNMGRSGLLWIGEKFYKTPAEFNLESSALGISRRIHAVPRGFKLGETWVLLAHRKAVPVYETSGVLGGIPGTETQTLAGFTPGIFRVFRPERIEKIITEEQAKNEEFMEGLAKRGLTPVIVAADDPDHQGSLWDKPEAEEL